MTVRCWTLLLPGHTRRVSTMAAGLVSLALMATLSAFVSAGPHSRDTCAPGKLVVYKVVVDTFWSKEKFPKQYPLWRPPAQFSKFLGKCPSDERMNV